MTAVSGFDARSFQDLLTTQAIGRFLVYRASVDSTMRLARREADEGASHGTLVLADEQTAGRGRRGRSFASPPGDNLYFTLILRLPLAQHRLLPLILPLAVCEACCAEGVEARIKWPNDIWVGERKLSGMLIDAELGPTGPLAMPGIGINVNGDPTRIPELRDIATSLQRELGRPVSPPRLLANICNTLERNLEMESAAALVEAYRGYSLVLGREIAVTPAVGLAYSARASAIREDGALEVTVEGGAVRILLAEDVSVRPAITT